MAARNFGDDELVLRRYNLVHEAGCTIDLAVKKAGHWSAGWRGAVLGAVLTAAFSMVLWQHTRLGTLLEYCSYDLIFLFKPSTHPDEVRIVYLDDKSRTELKQAPAWDRGLHAGLLDRLGQAGAKLIVFDMTFTDPGTDTNQLFAQALKRNRPVVLAASRKKDSGTGVPLDAVDPPLQVFAEAAAWGLAEIVRETDGIARRYGPGKEQEPSLPWVAISFLIKPDIAETIRADLAHHWLNYYGPPDSNPPTFRSVSYVDATNQPPEFFAGKFIFIGSAENTPHPMSGLDRFRTPYWSWGHEETPGVDLAATAFLNLYRREWLTSLLTIQQEDWALAVVALWFGAALFFLRPLVAGAIVILLWPVLALLATWSAVRWHVWFPWLAVAVLPGPAAFAWSLVCRRANRRRLASAGENIGVSTTESNAVAPASVQSIPAPPARSTPTISDHALLRCVGRGAYGDVWLARDVIGTFHAVKLIYRSSFDSDAPFEREFRGMQKYTPISRHHAGWVHILHVGRNDAEGYFYYVMEPADDEVSAQEIDPERYRPRNLANELRTRRRLPVEECVAIGIALAEALDYLHSHLLVHRDIKPSNVIFVHGVPKFTDVGLVTEARNRDQDVSIVGTAGYLAPEGPGTAAADIYSLGKLLYEISTGSDRLAFPSASPSYLAEVTDTLHHEFEKVVIVACQEDPANRYRSALELKDALLKLPRS